MNELYHHGIKGMHWGIRRYQNSDGTYTDAGKRRERVADERRARQNDKIARKEATRQRSWNAKNSALLSDEELTNQILRLQREKQLKDLTAQTVRPGKKKALDYMERYGSQALSAIVTAGTAAYVTNAMTARSNKRLAEKGYPVNIKGWHVEDGTLIPNNQ